FFFSSRRRHTRCYRDWSSDVCSSDLWNFWAVARKKSMRLLRLWVWLALLPGMTARETARAAAHSTAGQQPAAPASQMTSGMDIEIGRASCRERGRSCDGDVGV